jgi:tRNA (adenine57-N1/adenine58-N1)-methyltransferase
LIQFEAGETILLIGPDKKRLLVNLTSEGEQHTHQGIVPHASIVGQLPGSLVKSHNGRNFRVLRPSMEELLVSVQRATQIIFPKDIGYILLKLSIVPGARVVEAGTGSGALSTAIARYVGPHGQLYTYEQREEFYRLSGKNLARAGVTDSVTRYNREISEGFHERDVDAVFLDVRQPWDFLDQVTEALAPGGFFGCILPTVNQLIDITRALDEEDFEDIEIAELLLRQYKPVHERLRPMDRLTAHTGFLVFARKVLPWVEPEDEVEVEVEEVEEVEVEMEGAEPEAPSESDVEDAEQHVSERAARKTHGRNRDT